MNHKRNRTRIGKAVLASAALVTAGLLGMATPAAAVDIQPPAGNAQSACDTGWRQVNWMANWFNVDRHTYYVNPGVRVEWRWFQGGPFPYWYNTFGGDNFGEIIVNPSAYTSVEMKCTSPSPVWIR